MPLVAIPAFVRGMRHARIGQGLSEEDAHAPSASSFGNTNQNSGREMNFYCINKQLT
jgi:hypothetical protein